MFKEYLKLRYEHKIADKIYKQLNLMNNARIEDYCEIINEFLKTDYHQKLKLCYDLFDHDGDGYISLVDIFHYLKFLKKTDYYLSRDITKLLNFLSKKKVKYETQKKDGIVLVEDVIDSEIGGDIKNKQQAQMDLNVNIKTNKISFITPGYEPPKVNMKRRLDPDYGQKRGEKMKRNKSNPHSSHFSSKRQSR